MPGACGVGRIPAATPKQHPLYGVPQQREVYGECTLQSSCNVTYLLQQLEVGLWNVE